MPEERDSNERNVDAVVEQNGAGDEQGDNEDEDENEASTDDAGVTRVVLRRGSTGFGFGIRATQGPGPLLIGKLASGGEASRHPELQSGARIVGINGQDTQTISRGRRHGMSRG